MKTLILPGIGNSGPEHWQSVWERQDASCERLMQDEWDAPRREDWVRALDAAVRAAKESLVLVTHSSSCALVAHWRCTASAASLERIHGALLVAPSDPTGPNYPVGPTGFAPVPLVELPFPSIVVASTNDIYVSLDRAQEYADAWGSSFVNAGPTGHINAASGLGDWPEGYSLLRGLRARS